MMPPLTEPVVAAAYGAVTLPFVGYLLAVVALADGRLRGVTWRGDAARAWSGVRAGLGVWLDNARADASDRRDLVLRLVAIPIGGALIARAGIWGLFAAAIDADSDVETGVRAVPIDIPQPLAWAARLTTCAFGLAAVAGIGIPAWGWGPVATNGAYAWLAANLAVLVGDPLVGVADAIRHS
jgi:hypothetical protein